MRLKRMTAALLSALLIGVTAPLRAAGPAAAAEAPPAEGEIRKVDPAAGKVTIRHGPLPHLGMPAMTMVFRVRDPAMLEALRPGDRIRFVAEKLDGTYTVTRFEHLP